MSDSSLLEGKLMITQMHNFSYYAFDCLRHFLVSILLTTSAKVDNTGNKAGNGEIAVEAYDISYNYGYLIQTITALVYPSLPLPNCPRYF